MIEYEIFTLGMTVSRIEKGRYSMFENVTKFINKIGESKVIGITSILNSIIVWYKVD